MIDEPERHPNRAERRRMEHQKNRAYTKKGNTRVILRDDQGKLWNIPTKVNSKIHKIAQHNVKKMKRGARGE